MNTLTPSEAAAVGGFLGSTLAVFAICTLALSIVLIIACWKIFTKAGEKGWKSIIPIYNMVVLFRLIGISPWWVLVLFIFALIPGLTGNINTAGNYIVTDNVFGNIMLVALVFVSIFIDIYSSYRLAKAFGKGIGFTIGLILLPVVFYLILGFGSAKYDKKAALKA